MDHDGLFANGDRLESARWFGKGRDGIAQVLARDSIDLLPASVRGAQPPKHIIERTVLEHQHNDMVDLLKIRIHGYLPLRLLALSAVSRLSSREQLEAWMEAPGLFSIQNFLEELS